MRTVSSEERFSLRPSFPESQEDVRFRFGVRIIKPLPVDDAEEAKIRAESQQTETPSTAKLSSAPVSSWPRSIERPAEPCDLHRS